MKKAILMFAAAMMGLMLLAIGYGATAQQRVFLGYFPNQSYISTYPYAVGDTITTGGVTYISNVYPNVGNTPSSTITGYCAGFAVPCWTQVSGSGSGPGSYLPLAGGTLTGNIGEVSQTMTAADANSINVPSTTIYTHIFDQSTFALPAVTSGLGSQSQDYRTLNAYGPGLNLGSFDGAGGRVVTQLALSGTFAERGISQMFSAYGVKHAVGDFNTYNYLYSDGGSNAAADEGIGLGNYSGGETTGYYHGTISSTTGTGDIAPVLATATSGNPWTTDGTFLLDISKGTVSGNYAGASTQFGATYLFQIPVTNTLPLSTAWGTLTAVIPNPGVTPNNPVTNTYTVTLGTIGGSSPSFTAGKVCIAGPNYPEQAILTNPGAASGGAQTITLTYHNPNGSGSQHPIIFQGGVCGQYISQDQDLAYSGYRTSYYAFGAVTTGNLIYGVNSHDSLTTQGLPFASGAQTTTGGYHLYPGAEIVENTSTGAAPVLEPNSVAWATSDLIENPHYPVVNTNGLKLDVTQNTPANNANSAVGTFYARGYGVGGVNYFGFRLINAQPCSQYSDCSGSNNYPQSPIGAYNVGGYWASPFHSDYGPSASGAMLDIGGTFKGDTSAFLVAQLRNGTGAGPIIGYNPATSATYVPKFQITGITGSTQCVHVNSVGLMSGTGSDCGSGTAGVSSINTATGAFTFTGSGVSCSSTTCTFTGGGGGTGTQYSPAYFSATNTVGGVTPFNGVAVFSTTGPPAPPTGTGGTGTYIGGDNAYHPATPVGTPGQGAFSNLGSTAYAPASFSGDFTCSISTLGLCTVTQTNGITLSQIRGGVGTHPLIWGFGDSITYGAGDYQAAGSIPGASTYFNILAQDAGASRLNYAVPSWFQEDISSQAVAYFNQPTTTSNIGLPTTTIVHFGGVNNANTCGNTTDCLNNFTAAESAAQAWFEYPQSQRIMASAATSETNFAADTAVTVASTTTGTAMQSTTAGGTLVFTVPSGTGGTMGLTWIGRNSNAGTFTVTRSVEGAVNNFCAATPATWQSYGCGTTALNFFLYTYAPLRQEFAVTAGETVTITVTSATGAGNIVSILSADFSPAATTPATGQLLVQVGVIPQGANANAAATLAFDNASSAQTAAEVAKGMNIVFDDIRSPVTAAGITVSALNTSTDYQPTGTGPCFQTTDGNNALHPNAYCGHPKIARHIEATLFNAGAAISPIGNGAIRNSQLSVPISGPFGVYNLNTVAAGAYANAPFYSTTAPNGVFMSYGGGSFTIANVGFSAYYNRLQSKYTTGFISGPNGGWSFANCPNQTASFANCSEPAGVTLGGSFWTAPVTVTSSATPALIATNGAQIITLSANATPTVSGIFAGVKTTIDICQPASGGPYTWTWPTAFVNAAAISTAASSCTAQTFQSLDGTTLISISPPSAGSGPANVYTSGAFTGIGAGATSPTSTLVVNGSTSTLETVKAGSAQSGDIFDVSSTGTCFLCVTQAGAINMQGGVNQVNIATTAGRFGIPVITYDSNSITTAHTTAITTPVVIASSAYTGGTSLTQMFKVHCYMNVAATGGTSVTLQLAWTDNVGAKTSSFSPMTTTATTTYFDTGELLIPLAYNGTVNNIQYTTSLSGSGMTYGVTCHAEEVNW